MPSPERGADMRRREFLGVFGGAAMAWPIVARAQQPERVRRIGILQNFPENDPVASVLNATLLKELRQSGWAVGNNIRIETRWAGNRSDDIRRHVAELVALMPDVILANGTSTLGPLLQVSRTIPIVFVQVTDPVGSGYVESLAKPGGNATGFSTSEYGVSGKLRRRDFITGIAGSAAAWPLAARAQQPAMPVIGLLSSRSAATD